MREPHDDDYRKSAEPPMDLIRQAADELRMLGDLEWVAVWLDGYVERHQPAEQREARSTTEPEPFFYRHSPDYPADERWRVCRLFGAQVGEPASENPQDDREGIDLGVGFASEVEARADAQRRTDKYRAAVGASTGELPPAA